MAGFRFEYSRKAEADFALEFHGSVVLLDQITPAAEEWVADHIPDDNEFWCGQVVIEPRYVEPLVRAIVRDGLTVSRRF